MAGAPALVAVDPTNSSGFVTDSVYGNSRTVYHVGGNSSNAGQGGLTFNSTGLLTSNSYSVALTLKFFDQNNAYRRILDTSNRQSDNGFYVNPSNNLAVYPNAGSSNAFINGVYQNIVLTVAPGATGSPSTVGTYIAGGQQFTTPTDVVNISASNLINLFLDNVVGGGQGEWSQANIASAAFYDGVLTQAEISRINGDPFVTPPPPGGGGTTAVPEPASWAMMLAGFGAVGGALRRRRVRVAFA